MQHTIDLPNVGRFILIYIVNVYHGRIVIEELRIGPGRRVEVISCHRATYDQQYQKI